MTGDHFWWLAAELFLIDCQLKKCINYSTFFGYFCCVRSFWLENVAFGVVLIERFKLPQHRSTSHFPLPTSHFPLSIWQFSIWWPPHSRHIPRDVSLQDANGLATLVTICVCVCVRDYVGVCVSGNCLPFVSGVCFLGLARLCCCFKIKMNARKQ